MPSIKVLGPGHSNCKRTEDVVQPAAAILAPEARIEKVTDCAEIAELRILGTLSLVVDARVGCTGRIPG